MNRVVTIRGFAAATFGLSLSACASAYLSDLRHWNALSQGPLREQFGDWAQCIDTSIAQGGNFVAVLNRCENRKGLAWSRLTYEQERRLINAAWGAYKDAEYEMNFRDAEAKKN